MAKTHPIIVLYLAAAVKDAGAVDARPGAVAVMNGRVLAAGSPERVRERIAATEAATAAATAATAVAVEDAVEDARRLGKGGQVGDVPVPEIGPAARGGQEIEGGHTAEVMQAEAGSEVVETIDLGDVLLLPGMVNAHAHLDLTLIGPVPYDAESGEFSAWLRGVANDRPKAETDIRAAVTRGCTASREAGVAYLGDIANSLVAIDARRRTGLAGVSYLECFGPGRWQDETIEMLRVMIEDVERGANGVRFGISPHAPYTTGPDIYAYVANLARERGVPVSTHLAESEDEERFTRGLDGPFVEHLKRFGKWDESVMARTPVGLHPVDWLGESLDDAGWLLAHCNRVGDAQIARLAAAKASVAYCPVASDYFGHTHVDANPHRYREMLAAGINVCLGTDSILCQSLLVDEPQPMSILAQMRYLHERDGTDADLLLRMATTHGMTALGLDPKDATFSEGAVAHINAIKIGRTPDQDALVQVLRSREPIGVL